MHPILFHIGPITIYSYGVMMAVAVLVCAFLLSRDARKKNIPQDFIYDLVFWCVLWGILGARVFYIFLNLSYFTDNWLEIPMLQKGGLAWQGGFIGGTLAGLWFVRQKKIALRPVLDLVAPYIALGQAIGRIGCFLNGCCYGKPLAWGVFFPAQNAHLHPTQLYETAGLLAVFVVLIYASRRPHPPGYIFVLYLWLAAIERFTVEFFRADHDILMAGLSLFQWISIGIFVAGLLIFKRWGK